MAISNEVAGDFSRFETDWWEYVSMIEGDDDELINKIQNDIRMTIDQLARLGDSVITHRLYWNPDLKMFVLGNVREKFLSRTQLGASFVGKFYDRKTFLNWIRFDLHDTMNDHPERVRNSKRWTRTKMDSVYLGPVSIEDAGVVRDRAGVSNEQVVVAGFAVNRFSGAILRKLITSSCSGYNRDREDAEMCERILARVARTVWQPSKEVQTPHKTSPVDISYRSNLVLDHLAQLALYHMLTHSSSHITFWHVLVLIKIARHVDNCVLTTALRDEIIRQNNEAGYVVSVQDINTIFATKW